MKKTLFILSAAILLLILVSLPALATKPQDASGDWDYLPLGDELLKEAGGNTFLWDVEIGEWSGTFEGQSADAGIVVLHRSGRASFNGEVTFDSVLVDGKTGTLEMRVNGTKPDLSPYSSWKGYWVISDAGGELAGLKGQGTWSGPGWQGIPGEWGHIEYEGSIHFE